jgi:large subunit ribosomal protein L24
MAARIKKGDRVVVLAGKDKGRQGEVLKVLPAEGRVVVQGVQMVKRHLKQSAQNPQGGIVSKEASLDVSNIAHIDPKDGKPTRIGFRFLQDGRKVRFAKRSGEQIDR